MNINKRGVSAQGFGGASSSSGGGSREARPDTTAESLWRKMETARSPYLDKAKDCCRLTIPALLCFFEEGGRSEDITLYQAIGARGVSSLASKLLTALTPVNVPMFRLTVADETLKEKREEEDENWPTEIEAALSRYADAVLNAIKASGDYAHMYEVWQLLLVSGNVLVADPADNGNVKVYSLRDYVLKRDRSGNVLEIIVKESLSPKAMPADLLEKIRSGNDLPSNEPPASEKDKTEHYDLYTRVYREGNRFKTYQECKGIKIEGTQGEYPSDGCPFIPIRMYAGAGEDYSRSYVSNYLGDLKSADALSQGTVEGAAMAAKHLSMVDPSGVTDIKDLENSPNGAVIYGRANDVSSFQYNKGYDLRIVGEEAAKIERRLSQAFLLLDGGIRDAERVTREEIKAIAGELEAALGGVYSVMSHSFQTPYIKRKIFKLQKLGLLKPLDKNITPVVVTGFEALGMAGDKERLLEFVSLTTKVLGEAASGYIDPQNFIKRLASSMGINTSGLIKSEEALAAQAQAAQAQVAQEQLMDKALPAAIGNAEGLANVMASGEGS